MASFSVLRRTCCRSAPTTRRTGCSPPTACRPSRPAADRSSRSSPRRSRCSPQRRCATSRTSCGPATSRSCAAILDDPEASPNDRFVALDLLKNANIAAGGVLPMCQDTGTAIVMGKKGQHVLTGGGDEEAIARGVFDDLHTSSTCATRSWRRSTMYEEKNTGTNLPAQIEIYADRRRRVQVPVHGQGRRLGQQELPVPGDQGAAQPEARCWRSSTRRCARSAPPRARRTTSRSSSAARRRSSR